MTSMTRQFTLFCLLILITPACGQETQSDTQNVNHLLVTTATLVQQAHETSEHADAVKHLEQAMKNLDAIINDHPDTDTAVKLATGQTIGNLSKNHIQMLLNTAQAAVKKEAEREAEKKAILEAMRKRHEEGTTIANLNKEEKATIKRLKRLAARSPEDNEKALEEIYLLDSALQHITLVIIAQERIFLNDPDILNLFHEITERIESIEPTPHPETGRHDYEKEITRYEEAITLIEMTKAYGHERTAAECLSLISDPDIRQGVAEWLWREQQPSIRQAVADWFWDQQP